MRDGNESMDEIESNGDDNHATNLIGAPDAVDFSSTFPTQNDDINPTGEEEWTASLPIKQLTRRGMQEQKANPKYFGSDFTNFQFLQHTFKALDDYSHSHTGKLLSQWEHPIG